MNLLLARSLPSHSIAIEDAASLHVTGHARIIMYYVAARSDRDQGLQSAAALSCLHGASYRAARLLFRVLTTKPAGPQAIMVMSDLHSNHARMVMAPVLIFLDSLNSFSIGDRSVGHID